MRSVFVFRAWSSHKWSASVNDEKVQAEVKDGYIHLRRNWNAGDVVLLELDFEPNVYTQIQKYQKM